MRKINIKDIAEDSWTSPKGKFAGASKSLSIVLGRKESLTDLQDRDAFEMKSPSRSKRPTPNAQHPTSNIEVRVA